MSLLVLGAKTPPGGEVLCDLFAGARLRFACEVELRLFLRYFLNLVMAVPAYDLRDEKQAKEYLKNIGIEFRFQCYSEKSAEGIPVKTKKKRILNPR